MLVLIFMCVLMLHEHVSCSCLMFMFMFMLMVMSVLMVVVQVEDMELVCRILILSQRGHVKGTTALLVRMTKLTIATSVLASPA